MYIGRDFDHEIPQYVNLLPRGYLNNTIRTSRGNELSTTILGIQLELAQSSCTDASTNIQHENIQVSMLLGLFRAQRVEIIQKLVTELCESCDTVVPEETHGLDYFFFG
jgi:hypothetical protein